MTILFVFRGTSGDPVDFIQQTYHVQIPAGLAKAIGYWEALEIPSTLFDEHYETDRVLHQCQSPLGQSIPVQEGDLGFIDIRILGFNIVEE